jgi:type IV pilus assembly protein PilV
MSHPVPARPSGVSLIEVLVTLVLVAFSLLGIAAFQAKVNVGSIESYQRAQAAVLLADMQSRLSGNSANAGSYVTTTALGTGDTVNTDCTGMSGAALDKCEWSLELKGVAESTSTSTTTTNLGAMQGARGCITQVQAENDAVGVCTPAIYLITVAWQGLHQTKAPALSCGKGAYGTDDTYRRAIAARVSVGLPNCY